jgi:hypothetical protein
MRLLISFLPPLFIIPFILLQNLKGVTAEASCAGLNEDAQECGGNWRRQLCCCEGHVCGGEGRRRKTCVAGSNTGGTTCGGGGGGGGSCPTSLKVSCILWATTGGQQQHLHALISIWDQDDASVIGADVTSSLYVNGALDRSDVVYTTFDYSSSTSSTYPDLMDICPGKDNTDKATGVTSDICFNTAIQGDYKLEVTGITKAGCPDVFDNLDPMNVNEVVYPLEGRKNLRP